MPCHPNTRGIGREALITIYDPVSPERAYTFGEALRSMLMVAKPREQGTRQDTRMAQKKCGASQQRYGIRMLANLPASYRRNLFPLMRRLPTAPPRNRVRSSAERKLDARSSAKCSALCPPCLSGGSRFSDLRQCFFVPPLCKSSAMELAARLVRFSGDRGRRKKSRSDPAQA